MKVRTWRLVAIILVFAAGSLRSAPLESLPGEWNSDFGKAVEMARASGKDNLLVFTGLEWEPWSRKLRDDTLAAAGFHESLVPDFVLTHVDLPEAPKDKEKLGELELRHYELARDFKLHVFPAIYPCTPEGRPYGCVGYGEGGAEHLIAAIRGSKNAYVSLMEEIRVRNGAARAVAIDAWLQTLPEPLQAFHQDKMEMIVESDPGNETGLWFKYRMALLLPKARQHRYTGKLDESEALYLEVVNQVKPKGEALQDTWYELADVYFQRKDYDKLLEALDRAIEAAPESQRRSILDEMMETFTRQWVYQKCCPGEMKAAGYDCTKVELSSGASTELLKLATDAKNVAPGSSRNQVLDRMIQEKGKGVAGK